MSEKTDDLFHMLPWTEKYRPSSFLEIVSHKHIVNTLKIFIKNKSIPHMLFYGPPGTGKTTMINICAKELYGDYYQCMVMELNASDDRGIDIVRSKIKQFVTSSNVYFTQNMNSFTNQSTTSNILKLVILDEIDAMTQDAQSILKKIMETYSYNTRFCLICNYIQNINEALQSRCSTFRFSPILDKDLKIKINEIKEKENVNISESAIDIIINRSGGDMRNILNMLQSVNMIYNKDHHIIDSYDVNTCLGFPTNEDINKIFHSLLTDNYENSYKTIVQIKNNFGLSLEDIIKDMHNILIEYLINETIKYDIFNNLTYKNALEILRDLRTIEYHVVASGEENIQIGALIGLFKRYNINR